MSDIDTMSKRNYPEDVITLLNSIQGKRPKTVIQHILKYGYITTEELKEKYNYDHPPRAARDVRECGIPLVTFRVKGKDGRSIGAYKFGDFAKTADKVSRVAGRTVLSKSLKDALVKKYGAKCFIYLQPMDENILQVDHRIPYEIAGEQDDKNIELFMLLSPSANRAKSWTCEHCVNWEKREKSICAKCFWAHPEDYDHVAGKREKIVSVVFTGDEIVDYNRLIEQCGVSNAQIEIKKLIHDRVSNHKA